MFTVITENIGESNCILLAAIILTEMFLLTVRDMCNVCLPWSQRNLGITTHKRAFMHMHVHAHVCAHTHTDTHGSRILINYMLTKFDLSKW